MSTDTPPAQITRSDASVAATLNWMSSYLYDNTADAARIWDALDRDRTGVLQYDLVASFFRQVGLVQRAVCSPNTVLS